MTYPISASYGVQTAYTPLPTYKKPAQKNDAQFSVAKTTNPAKPQTKPLRDTVELSPAAVDALKAQRITAQSINTTYSPATINKAQKSAPRAKKRSINIDRADYNKTTAAKIKEKGAKTNLAVKSTQEALVLLKKEGGAVDEYITNMVEASGLTLNPDTRNKVRELLGKYLDANLDVYPYERISGILKEYDAKIKDLGEGTVFFRPQEGKSYDVLMALYQKINPDAKFVSDISALKNAKNVVILDDCSVSGNSLVDLYNEKVKDVLPKDGKVHAFFLTTYDEGISRIKYKLGAHNVSVNDDEPNKINVYYTGESKHILAETDFYKNLSVEDKNLLSTFLQVDAKVPRLQELKPLFKNANIDVKPTQGYQHSGAAILFDYMAPNNNSPFAALMLENLFDQNANFVFKDTKVPVSEIAIKRPGSFFASALSSTDSQLTKIKTYIDAYEKLVQSAQVPNPAAYDLELEALMDNYYELTEIRKGFEKKSA